MQKNGSTCQNIQERNYVLYKITNKVELEMWELYKNTEKARTGYLQSKICRVHLVQKGYNEIACA